MDLWNLPNDSDDEQFGAIINAVAAATRQQRGELDAILLELDDDLASQLEAAMQSVEAVTCNYSSSLCAGRSLRQERCSSVK